MKSDYTPNAFIRRLILNLPNPLNTYNNMLISFSLGGVKVQVDVQYLIMIIIII